MAYKTENEKRKVLAEIKKNERGDFIVLTAIKNVKNGNECLDIRMFYTSDNDELLPTQKGVRISYDNIDEFSKAIETFECEEVDYNTEK